MIEVLNVYKSYDKKENVIKNLNMVIKDGEIFGFLGPNGAGKTTTIKMITGILSIDKGDIILDGKSIAKDPIEAKKRFGFVPDSPDLFLKLKGIEYLNFIADIYEVSKEVREKSIDYWAKKFEIYDKLNLKIQEYSHGMKQKINIIGAILHSPKNLILDEPMVGLDPKSSFLLKDLMKEYAKSGNTVFFSTHALEVAEKICDRIGIIKNGTLIYMGTIDDLKANLKENQSLEDMFLNITGTNEEDDK